jgi:hypothetical protein
VCVLSGGSGASGRHRHQACVPACRPGTCTHDAHRWDILHTPADAPTANTRRRTKGQSSRLGSCCSHRGRAPELLESTTTTTHPPRPLRRASRVRSNAGQQVCCSRRLRQPSTRAHRMRAWKRARPRAHAATCVRTHACAAKLPAAAPRGVRDARPGLRNGWLCSWSAKPHGGRGTTSQHTGRSGGMPGLTLVAPTPENTLARGLLHTRAHMHTHTHTRNNTQCQHACPRGWDARSTGRHSLRSSTRVLTLFPAKWTWARVRGTDCDCDAGCNKAASECATQPPNPHR